MFIDSSCFLSLSFHQTPFLFSAPSLPFLHLLVHLSSPSFVNLLVMYSSSSFPPSSSSSSSTWSHPPFFPLSHVLLFLFQLHLLLHLSPHSSPAVLYFPLFHFCSTSLLLHLTSPPPLFFCPLSHPSLIQSCFHLLLLVLVMSSFSFVLNFLLFPFLLPPDLTSPLTPPFFPCFFCPALSHPSLIQSSCHLLLPSLLLLLLPVFFFFFFFFFFFHLVLSLYLLWQLVRCVCVCVCVCVWRREQQRTDLQFRARDCKYQREREREQEGVRGEGGDERRREGGGAERVKRGQRGDDRWCVCVCVCVCGTTCY